MAQCLASGAFIRSRQDNAESRAYLEGIDVLLWSDFDELAHALEHYLANPAEREAMAARSA